MTIDETALTTWFERDRAHVELKRKDDDTTIVEWWDEQVDQAIEDGYLDGDAFILGKLIRPNLLHTSIYEYAVDLGLIARG